jgi:hypothetical protein
MRAVICPQVGESETLHARTRELRLGVDHGNLLIERHTAEGIVDALLHRFALVEVNGYDLRM